MMEWAPPDDRQASKGIQWWERDSRPGGSQRTVARSVLRSVAVAFLASCLTLGTVTAAGYVVKGPVIIRSLGAVWSDVLQAVVGERSESAVDPGDHPLNFLTEGEQKTPQGDEAPGHDEDGPGGSEEAPGHDEDGPGGSEEAPGHDEDGPGRSEEAPGHDEDGPGRSEEAPGHDEDGPGRSEEAPGHDEDGPGRSEEAPGHDEDGPGRSEEAPGHDEGGPGRSEEAPGHNEGKPGK